MEENLKDYTQYGPLTLAYLGDAVYDLEIRALLVRRADVQTARLHQRASAMVCAGAQARMMEALLPLLTAQEEAVYRRGHNAKPYHTAKHASRTEYLEATGFEALMGYLYLQGQQERMRELIREGLHRTLLWTDEG